MSSKNYAFNEEELYSLYNLTNLEKPLAEMTQLEVTQELYLTELFCNKDVKRIIDVIEKMTEEEWLEFREEIPKMTAYIKYEGEDDPLIDENGCFIVYPEDDEE